MDLFRQQAKEKGLLLTADMDANVNRLVIGDPARIRQILVNLVNNALKFTDKGQVTLKVTSKIEKGAEENLLHFSVKDTGIGIPEEAHKLLFQRFSQVGTGNARKYGGSGLGLLISKQLVQMMNGSIGFESQPGQGSTFWFHLPLALSNHVNTAQPLSPTQKISETNGTKPLRILAVDDNSDSRSLLSLLLKKMGHNVTVAQDGPDALSQLNQDSYDLVLMDIQMPGMDGYEATHQIRTMVNGKSSIPVIALTANAMAGDSEKAFKAGMDDYITKPIHLDALKNLLAKWSQKIR
jgi:CheY-like chemotaxis protein